MSTRRMIARRLDALADRQESRPDPTMRAYARAVIAFGGTEPYPASSAALARWLDGGWRERT